MYNKIVQESHVTAPLIIKTEDQCSGAVLMIDEKLNENKTWLSS